MIISFSAGRGVGKDTIANELIQRYDFQKMALADPLKDIVSTIFGWDRHLLEGVTAQAREWRALPDVWWEKELDWDSHPGKAYSIRFTPLVALQFIGTDVFRKHFCPSMWSSILKNRLRYTKNDVVITDTRFPEEFNVIKECGGFCYELRRGPLPDFYVPAFNVNTGLIAGYDKEQAYRDLEKEFKVHRSEFAWIGLPFDDVVSNNTAPRDVAQYVHSISKRSRTAKD